MTDILLRPFQAKDQNAARALILAGLGEHFEELNPTLNPDIENIYYNYLSQGHWFWVAEIRDELVGTGALLRETVDTVRIVRMSVSSKRRRQGIGRLLAHKLIEVASDAGFASMVVETNDDWNEAIRLYLDCGFTPYDHRNGEIHMQIELSE